MRNPVIFLLATVVLLSCNKQSTEPAITVNNNPVNNEPYTVNYPAKITLGNNIGMGKGDINIISNNEEKPLLNVTLGPLPEHVQGNISLSQYVIPFATRMSFSAELAPPGTYPVYFTITEEDGSNKDYPFELVIPETNGSDCIDYFYEAWRNSKENVRLYSGVAGGSETGALSWYSGKGDEAITITYLPLRKSGFESWYYYRDTNKGMQVYADCQSQTLTIHPTDITAVSEDGDIPGSFEGKGSFNIQDGTFSIDCIWAPDGKTEAKYTIKGKLSAQ